MHLCTLVACGKEMGHTIKEQSGHGWPVRLWRPGFEFGVKHPPLNRKRGVSFWIL